MIIQSFLAAQRVTAQYKAGGLNLMTDQYIFKPAREQIVASLKTGLLPKKRRVCVCLCVCVYPYFFHFPYLISMINDTEKLPHPKTIL